MTTFQTAIPPLLEQELTRILRRYRRVRFLRATLKFLVYLTPTVLFAVLTSVVTLPVPAAFLVSIASILAIGALIAAYTPLFTQPATLRDIAVHIDQKHPHLQDRILSAVALTETSQEAPSEWMLENFFAETQQRVKGLPLDDFMSSREYRLLAAGVATSALLCGALSLYAAWNFGILRSATGGLAERTPTEFSVEPGNATVQPGDNQIIWVTSPDTTATRHIYWERNGVEQRAILEPSSTPEVAFHNFLAMQDSLRYHVSVGQTVSETYEITVSRPPGAESIQVRYDYPEYLGLEPTIAPYSGEIAAVEGTRVTVRVEANKPLESAQLVLDTGQDLPLENVEANYWETGFTLERSGRYHLALKDLSGEENPDPEDYAIRVNPDNPPEIHVKFPRGDAKVLALEEVPLAFEVEDDYGIEGYGIEYALAGEAPVRLALNTPGETLQQAVAGHLLALEDMGLTNGDLITWSVWATDRKPGRASYDVLGDPYFLEVRPYTLRYQERISQGGGMPGGGGGSDAAMDQKKIIIALTNLRKRARTLDEADYAEQEGQIAASQAELREKLMDASAEFEAGQRAIAEEAFQHMEIVQEALANAAWPEPQVALGDAIDAAKSAWQAVLKLEPDLREVARQEGGGGGGGGAAQQELDALEMGQRKDYLEEASTGEEQAAQNEEARNALDDLARRQEMLNDDLGKLLSEDEKERDAEEKKRQLERLQEEQQRQLERLDELRNQVASSQMSPEQRQAAGSTLDQARRDMERGMEAVREEELQQARASGKRAAQNLQEAEAALDQLTREGARERFAALQDEVEALGARQEAVRDEASALKEAQDAPGVEGHDTWSDRVEALKNEKQAMADEAKDLLEGAGGLSDQLRDNQELLSRKLGDWVRRTSRTGIVEDIEEGMQLVEYGVWDAAERQETQIKNKIDEAARTLESLRPYLPGEGDDSMERALDLLTQLDGMDSEPGGDSDGTEGAETPGQVASAQPGDTPSDQTSEKTNAQQPGGEQPNGEQPTGQQPSGEQPTGEQPGGEQPGGEQANGQQPGGEQPGGQSSQPGDAGQPSGSPGQQPSSPGSSPTGQGGQSSGGGDSGSDASASETFGGPRGLGDFFDGDARDWRPVLRDAASLLPRESAERQSLEQVEMDLGRLQRVYDHDKKLPDAEEFEQVVRRPLIDTIATLEQRVRDKADDNAAWLEDEGAIPVQYVDRVAEYFRLLAEQPEAP